MFGVIAGTGESHSGVEKTNSLFLVFARWGAEEAKRHNWEKMHQILKLTPYSQSQAYFLINMHKLSQDYSRIMCSSLPIRFFKNNLKTIISVCESDAAKFQLWEAKTIQRFETSNCLRVHYDYFISLMREIWNDGYMHWQK